jgi:hypothetical protein
MITAAATRGLDRDSFGRAAAFDLVFAGTGSAPISILRRCMARAWS